MDQKEQIVNVAHVLWNWEEYSRGASTRGRKHSGLKNIEGKGKVAAERIVQKNWNGRMVVSSIFKMIVEVER